MIDQVETEGIANPVSQDAMTAPPSRTPATAAALETTVG